MNTEAKPTVRTDALVATLVLAALGLLWLVFRLYWQGLLLLVAASGVAYLGVLRARAGADAQSEAQPSTSKPEPQARADKPRRAKSGKKRRRRK